ncbi:MupG family TIM beta-alpha barrel fold protein [Staphylococcus massiliensis]|uniref:Outer surface protein n=1 Tax=Staphylococcus massiliensis S46 TaxID=1229783 RepID=K9ANW1_9STAP|nr:MupG family TIM beta-alpha barrel fold protein [Staphylococcus massiliensis]EKU48989.1 hypothetical protein C273_04270 [Staphylococcus massiliensis S46]MCG3399430.1 DUF871 family protein [Staphylococcus massiliensis]MCG3402470.1 DUF871 family protein [Staphylococcus massiliensis]MCG3411566.1 DUF871 family protein [Staphylococcus massiliensis]PNZ99464.1 DUF871 domain-containing protein [Staphylococcus massiliensis CCUG 55927]
MLGFSIYFSHEPNYDYEKSLLDMGYKTIFTSIQIPEEEQKDPLDMLEHRLNKLSSESLNIIVDANPEVINDQLFNLMSKYPSLQLIIRIDHSVSLELVKECVSNNVKVCLNASTISQEDLKQFHEAKIPKSQMIYCHNYYPRPETGLSQSHVLKQNQLIRSFDNEATIYGFIPGTSFRGPIHKGLPTLESARGTTVIDASYQLLDSGVNHIIVGDHYISLFEASRLYKAIMNQHFELPLKWFNDSYQTELFKRHTNRPDVAEQVIRSMHSRTECQRTIPIEENLDRPEGTITIDNKLYGRYEGEVQITKVNLPKTDSVNVVAQIDSTYIKELKYIKGNHTFEFVKGEE